MKTNHSNAIRQAAYVAVCTWGLLSLLFVSGEPATEMSAAHFALLKVLGLISLVGAILTGRQLERTGWIKFSPEDDIA